MKISDGPLCCVNTARTKEAAGRGFHHFKIAVFIGSPSGAGSNIQALLSARKKNPVPPALHSR